MEGAPPAPTATRPLAGVDSPVQIPSRENHMPDDLSVAVESLRTATQRLNAICDSATQVVRDVEAFLEECHIGIETSVLVKSDDETGEEKYFTHTLLGYRRVNGKFRIVVLIDPVDGHGPEDVIVRPWFEAGRDEKLETLEKLPELLVQLGKHVEVKATKAHQVLSALTFELPAPKKPKGVK